MQSTPRTPLPFYPDRKCIVSDALLASQCRPYQWRASPVLWGAASRKLQVCVSPPAVSTPVNTEAVALWSSPVDVRHHNLLPSPIHICTWSIITRYYLIISLRENLLSFAIYFPTHDKAPRIYHKSSIWLLQSISAGFDRRWYKHWREVRCWPICSPCSEGWAEPGQLKSRPPSRVLYS